VYQSVELENVLPQNFKGPSPGKILGKTRPFRETPVKRKGGGQAGGGKYETRTKKVRCKPYSSDQSGL